MSLATECFSMNSLMSMRTMAFSSSNMNSARARASSVIRPTHRTGLEPVDFRGGGDNMKLLALGEVLSPTSGSRRV